MRHADLGSVAWLWMQPAEAEAGTTALTALADAQRLVLRYNEAVATATEAVATRCDLVRLDPVRYQSGLAMGMMGLALALRAARRVGEAVTTATEAVALSPVPTRAQHPHRVWLRSTTGE